MNFLTNQWNYIKKLASVMALIFTIIAGGWIVYLYDVSKEPQSIDKQLIVEGENALNVGHYNEAERIFENELQANPKNQPAEWGLKVAQLRLSISKPEFKETIDELYQQDPNDAHLSLFLGEFFTAQEQPDKALPYFEQAIIQNPKLAEAHNALALFYEKLGDFETAKVESLEAIDTSPSAVPRYRNNLGTIYFKQQHFEEAIKEYGKNKEYPLSMLESARVYWHLEYFSQATTNQNQAIEWLNNQIIMAKPENQEAWYFQVSPQKSVQLVTIEEKKVYAYYCLSISLFLQGDKLGAENELKKLSDLTLTRSANIAALLSSTLDTLVQSNSRFTDQVIVYKQLYL
jgi:tetratricopeptide (TPR) repeat protein